MDPKLDRLDTLFLFLYKSCVYKSLKLLGIHYGICHPYSFITFKYIKLFFYLQHSHSWIFFFFAQGICQQYMKLLLTFLFKSTNVNQCQGTFLNPHQLFSKSTPVYNVASLDNLVSLI